MPSRFASAVALASVAALALVGCAPADPTEEELLGRASAAVDGFNAVLSQPWESESTAATRLAEFASPTLANEWASYLAESNERGETSVGQPTISNHELVQHEGEHLSTELCLDGSAVVTTLADGSKVTPEPTAWSASFVVVDGAVVLDTFDPIADESVCA